MRNLYNIINWVGEKSSVIYFSDAYIAAVKLLWKNEVGTWGRANFSVFTILLSKSVALGTVMFVTMLEVTKYYKTKHCRPPLCLE